MKSYDNYVCELHKAYSEKCFPNGRCPYFEECSKGRSYNEECSIISNQNVKIGEEYGKCYPKILFIGKENTSRTPFDEIGRPADFIEQKNQHYVRTKFILAALLGSISKEQISEYNGYDHPEIKEEKELCKKFALTNHYHCAFKKDNKNHGIKVTDTMWDNCAKITAQEIEVLEPDIIVIQGGWSAKDKHTANKMNGIYAYFFNDKNKWEIAEDDSIYGLYWATDKTNGKMCCIIGSYHPAFHLWHQEEYLIPLKQRIEKANRWIYK